MTFLANDVQELVLCGASVRVGAHQFTLDELRQLALAARDKGRLTITDARRVPPDVRHAIALACGSHVTFDFA